MTKFSLTVLNCWEWAGLRKVGLKHLKRLRSYLNLQLEQSKVLALTELSWLGAIWLWRQKASFIYRPSSIVGNALVFPVGKVIKRVGSYYNVQHFEMRNWLKMTVSFSQVEIVFWHTHLERGSGLKQEKVRYAQLLELLKRIEEEKTFNQILSGDFNFCLGYEDLFNQEMAKSGFEFFGKGVDLVGVRGNITVMKVWQEPPLYLFKGGRWKVQEKGAPTDHLTGALHLDLAVTPS